jgi:hypothetical protein
MIEQGEFSRVSGCRCRPSASAAACLPDPGRGAALSGNFFHEHSAFARRLVGTSPAGFPRRFRIHLPSPRAELQQKHRSAGLLQRAPPTPHRLPAAKAALLRGVQQASVTSWRIGLCSCIVEQKKTSTAVSFRTSYYTLTPVALALSANSSTPDYWQCHRALDQLHIHIHENIG